MNKIRETIRLNEVCNLSNRQIALALNISRPVVSQYLTDYTSSGLTYADIEKLSDDDLIKYFESDKKNESDKYLKLSEKFEYFIKELKKTGVTLDTLWQEYRKENPNGYGRSQFCYHFQVWRNASEVTMHIEHKAGEKLFIDFTGDKLMVYDRKTGIGHEVEVLVAILGASQLTYVEAVKSQKKEDWIKANDNALWYIGGVPQAIVPDCLKSAVVNGNKYEPDINPEYNDFARHYGTVILPARPNTPKDKAMVENAIKIVYTRIFAPLRNRIFYSIEELNSAIMELLEIHNNKQFQRMKVSRWELFNETEKHMLKPLPCCRYELRGFLNLTVQFNYHILFSPDTHYYSVPWRYKGKRVNVLYTSESVELYHKNIRIAFHKRDRTVNRYTTLKEHMPSHHQFYSEWSPQRMISWGGAIGNDVKIMIEKVLESRKFPEQAYKVCLGILNLSKKYGNQRLNQACKRALQYNCYSYKSIKNILEKGLDKLQEEIVLAQLPVHNNIRGNQYFN
jgi:transposase